MKKIIKSDLASLIFFSFLACLFSTVNVFVYNFYYLRKVYKNVLTADGDWIISVDKILGYFHDFVGLTLSLINLSLIMIVVILYFLASLKDKREENKLLEEAKKKRIGVKP